MSMFLGMNITQTNMMSGEGFPGGLGVEWFGAWFLLAILVVGCMVLRRQCDDGQFAGTPYNFPLSFAGPLLFIITVTLIGSIKVAFVVGLIGLAAGGFGVAQFWDMDGGGTNI